MRGPNNVIFTSALAIFDEDMFPKCPHAVKRPSTRLQDNAPNPSLCPKNKGNCQCSPPGDEDKDEDNKKQPRQTPSKKDKGKEKKARDDDHSDHDEPPNPPPGPSSGGAPDWGHYSDSEDEHQPPPSRSPSPQPGPSQPAQGSTRPQRTKKVPKIPGNVYGDQHPTDILRKIRSKKNWSDIVGEKPSQKIGRAHV